MDNNIGNIKPSPTGGLKLMTVFVVVLGLHVLVISVICIYYVLKSPSTDTDQLTDKNHTKMDSALASNGQLPTDPSATTAMNPTPPVSAADATMSVPPPTTGTETPSTPDSSSVASMAPPATAPASPDAAPVTTTGTTTLAQADLRTESTPMGITPPPSPAVSTPAGTDTASPATAPAAVSTTASEPATAPDLAPPLDAAPTPYVVKSHDTLERIAHLNHITVAKLKEANSLNSDMLHIGQKLVIPVKAPTAVAETTPDVSASSATPTGVTAPTDHFAAQMSPDGAGKASAKITASVKPAKPAPTAVAVASPTLRHHVYTVVKGDTLTKIAHEFKTTPTALMAANDISDPTKLSIGKKLKIPAGETRSAKINEPAVTRPSQVQPTAPASVTTATMTPVLKDLGDRPTSAPSATASTPADATPDADDLLKPKTDESSSEVAIFP